MRLLIRSPAAQFHLCTFTRGLQNGVCVLHKHYRDIRLYDIIWLKESGQVPKSTKSEKHAKEKAAVADCSRLHFTSFTRFSSGKDGWSVPTSVWLCEMGFVVSLYHISIGIYRGRLPGCFLVWFRWGLCVVALGDNRCAVVESLRDSML
jgi:hypothetical protein